MSTSKMDLSGKVVVVTGASMGIGEAIARIFADQGASVVLLSRDAGRAEANGPWRFPVTSATARKSIASSASPCTISGASTFGLTTPVTG